MTEEAIKKAIEGGYEPFKTVKMSELNCALLGDHFGCNFKTLPNGQARGICGVSVYKILLDPDFWQSLGRAEGWIYTAGGMNGLREWRKFIDHLVLGGSPDSFFKELLTN